MNEYIPFGDIPLNGPQAHYVENRGEALFWLGNDSLANYQKNGGHPLYGEKDIVYRLNSYGYRCPEFDRTADIRMLSIGCSHVFGVGLPEAELFHEIIRSRLEKELSKRVINWNLASAGAGNDYISRMLFLAIEKLKPDLVIVDFAPLSRREYFAVTGQWVKFSPNNKLEWFDMVTREMHRYLAALTSDCEQEVSFFRNFKAVEALLRDLPWLYSFITDNLERALGPHMGDRKRYAGVFPCVDLARDHVHPGRESNRLLAESFWQKLVDNGYLEELA